MEISSQLLSWSKAGETWILECFGYQLKLPMVLQIAWRYTAVLCEMEINLATSEIIQLSHNDLSFSNSVCRLMQSCAETSVLQNLLKVCKQFNDLQSSIVSMKQRKLFYKSDETIFNFYDIIMITTKRSHEK